MELEKQIALLAKGLNDLTQIVVEQQKIISDTLLSPEKKVDKQELKDDEISDAMKDIVERHKKMAEEMAKSDKVKYRGW